MDRNAAGEDNRRMLQSIIALLYAFASLAEAASTRHHLVRVAVLWILRYAETVAREFVMDMAMENGASLTPAVLLRPALHGSDSSANAMRLARSFRALADLLVRLAYGNPGRPDMRIGKLCIELAARAAAACLLTRTRLGHRQFLGVLVTLALDST